jgi:peptidoglycan/xylan/chitin deacetylase (PgdA/CDA1 family)
MKVAFLSMDIEDWHHTTYLPPSDVPPSTSMLDGVEEFAAILQEERVPGTFFTLSCVADRLKDTLRLLHAEGHEVACHGDDHTLPRLFTTSDFAGRISAAKLHLEDVVGAPVVGYRAPCFALDEEKLEQLPRLGFVYDASWIRFVGHPLYGHMRLDHWPEVAPGMRMAPAAPHPGFVEFEVPSLAWRRWYLPIAGGGSFRIVPWSVTRRWLARFLATGRPYLFYIHPFECSSAHQRLPRSTGVAGRLRFNIGRAEVGRRIRWLIALLREHGYAFATHREAATALLAQQAAVGPRG